MGPLRGTEGRCESGICVLPSTPRPHFDTLGRDPLAFFGLLRGLISKESLRGPAASIDFLLRHNLRSLEIQTNIKDYPPPYRNADILSQRRRCADKNFLVLLADRDKAFWQTKCSFQLRETKAG